MEESQENAATSVKREREENGTEADAQGENILNRVLGTWFVVFSIFVVPRTCCEAAKTER